MRYIAALVLASTLITSGVSATIIVTNNTDAPRNDFHITFNNPPGRLTQRMTGKPFVPKKSDPKTVESSGWTVNGHGNPPSTLIIDGLDILKMDGKGHGNSRVLSWCFSLDGKCPKDDESPTVRFQEPQDKDPKDYTLEQLTHDKYGVYSLPEPTSWLTMMFGFAVIGMVLRRRSGIVVSA
jgi:hypothetical protein